MKTLFTTIGLLLISAVHAQDFIGKEWEIDNFLAEYEDVTDVYFLKTPYGKYSFGDRILFKSDGTFSSWLVADCGNTCSSPTIGTYQMVGKYLSIQVDRMEKRGVECDSIPIELHKRLGSYYIHKASNDEIYLIKSTGKIATDKQKIKNVEALAYFIKIYDIRGKSPNPSFQLKRDVPKDERIGKFVRKLFHLTSYEILKALPSDYSTHYLVKDLKTNTYYYLREEYFSNKVTVYYFTEKDLKQRAKERKKQR
ncbi:hypothetical protein RCZ04_12360 [Capnocytophaga sp. HP1101]